MEVKSDYWAYRVIHNMRIWGISVTLDLKFIFKIICSPIVFFIPCNSRTPCKNVYLVNLILNCQSPCARVVEASSSLCRGHGVALTFVTLVASVALRTALVPFTPLILVTRSTYREPTLVTRHKQPPIISKSDLVATNSTCLGGRLACWGPRLHNYIWRNIINRQNNWKNGDTNDEDDGWRQRGYLFIAMHYMKLVSLMRTSH